MNTWSEKWSRFIAIFIKETIQLRRDRLTLAMIVAIPLVQLILFGFVIDNDPRHLPTAVILGDESLYSRTILATLRNSDYFDLKERYTSSEEADEAMLRGDILFIITIPPNFQRDLLRGESPAVLVEADATDSVAVGSAVAALAQLPQVVAERPLADSPSVDPESAPLEVRIHRRYTPEAITQYNIVPGLIGVILTLTLVMMTALAITRERERGTMENLLSMPATPLETLCGKIAPYIFLGLIQVTLILAVALPLFRIPFEGKLWELYFAALLLITANLALGVLISAVATNQLQVMQLTLIWFMPNILLTGFMFPIAGMPQWAQWLSLILPLTWFHHLVRGILLRGATGGQLWPDLWPIMIFTVMVMFIAVRSYRRTLD